MSEVESLEAHFGLVSRGDWPALAGRVDESFWSSRVFASAAGWQRLFEVVPSAAAAAPLLGLPRLWLIAGLDRDRALDECERLHAGAAWAADPLAAGELAAIALVALLMRTQDTERAAVWAGRLAAARGQIIRFPGPEAELRVAAGTLSASLMTGAAPESTRALSARCVALLKGRIAPGVRAVVLDALLQTAAYGRELQQLNWTLRQLERTPAAPWLGPLHRMRHIDALAGSHFMLREFDRHRQVLDEGVALALAAADLDAAKAFLFALAQGALARADIETAGEAIARYEPYLDPASPHDLCHDAGNRALLATLRAEWELAEPHGRASVRYAELAGMPAYERCAFMAIHASTLTNLERYAEAAARYDDAARMAPGEIIGVEAGSARLARVFAGLHAGTLGAPAAAAAAAAVFRDVPPEQYVRLMSFKASRALAQAVHLAIRGGLSPESLRPLVAARNLAPPAGVGAAWPWFGRLRLLGGFDADALLPDAEPSRRAAAKPIELLQYLGAHAPQAVAVERLADALWPDADADLALHNLDVTSARLRKRLGRDDLIVRRRGRLALGEGILWIDCADLGVLAAGSGTLPFGALLDLYRGPLLPDSQAIWVIARRQALALLAGRAFERALAVQLGEGAPFDPGALADALAARELAVESLVVAALDRAVPALSPGRLAAVVPPLVNAVEVHLAGGVARRLRAFATRHGLRLE